MFCMQNLPIIKQLSSMLEQRRRDDLRTAENSAPLSILATLNLAEIESRNSFGTKSSISAVQI